MLFLHSKIHTISSTKLSRMPTSLDTRPCILQRQAHFTVTEALHKARENYMYAVIIFFLTCQLLLHCKSLALQDQYYHKAWPDSDSSPHSLITGVSQGSVLGPLLFSIHTKLLLSLIGSHVFSWLICCWHQTFPFFYLHPPPTLPTRYRTAFLISLPGWRPIIWNSTFTEQSLYTYQ